MEDQTKLEPLLSLREAAAVVKLHESTLRRAYLAGQIPGLRLRGKIFFETATIRALIEGARIKG